MRFLIYLTGFVVGLLAASAAWAVDPAPIFTDQGSHWSTSGRNAIPCCPQEALGPAR